MKRSYNKPHIEVLPTFKVSLADRVTVAA